MMFRFEYRPYRLALRVPLRTAQGRWSEREGVLVRMENAAGEVGYGDASPIPWFGTETAPAIAAGCASLGERCSAEQLAALPAEHTVLRHALGEAQRGFTTARETGASSAAAPARDGGAYLAVAALLPAGAAALREIATKAEAGFRVFKWKVGVGDPADELSLLDDVCARLPDGAQLRLDANGAWERRVAERWLARCAERPVEFLEQPVAPTARGADDVLLGLAGDYPTPIGLDESLVRDGDVQRWLDVGWPGVFVVKTALFADPEATLARLAAANAPVVFSSALETAVGAKAALTRAFAWTGGARALGFGVWPLFADRRFDGPAAAPFIRWSDVQRIDVEETWNALS